MLIQAHIIVLGLLLLTHTNAKSGRRKGLLRQPPELESWTGKWFPFDPTAITSTTTQKSTATNGGESRGESSNTIDDWPGKWFPFDPTAITSTTKAPTTSTTTQKSVITIPIGNPPEKSSNTIDDWPGKWFPFAKNGLKTKKAKPICDDGQHSIDIDFDPTDKRYSYNYLCLTKNRISYKPNMTLEAVLTEYIVPPAYVPPIKCLNETISYDDPLPTFGAFRPLPPKYGTYHYLPPQRWLRSVTEGAIAMLYHPCAFSGQVKLLQNTLKSCLFRHVITPSQNLSPERPLALIAWGKSLQMSVVDERTVVDFIKLNAKLGPLAVGTVLESRRTYEIGLLEEAKLITDIEDTEICGYKEM